MGLSQFDQILWIGSLDQNHASYTGNREVDYTPIDVFVATNMAKAELCRAI
jgi:hypothetical protein